MASSSSRMKSTGPVLCHGSPSSRVSSSSGFASSTTSFSPRSSAFFARSCSPTRVSLCGQNALLSPSARFSVDSPRSPGRSISVTKQSGGSSVSNQKKTCMCSPSTHPGSFRCSLHKKLSNVRTGSGENRSQTVSYQSQSLNIRRSAMTNSLVRIGGVEGDLVRRSLSSLIRPSSHHQRRRTEFQPRPSRLSAMSMADDLISHQIS